MHRETNKVGQYRTCMLPVEAAMWATALLIFAGELLLNWVHACYTASVARGGRVQPALLAAVGTAGGAIIWAVVLTSPNVVSVVAMSGGAAVGTALGLRR